MGTSGDIAVSPADDWLSGVVERRSGLFQKLGNLETRVFADRLAETAISRPIYICGLARSGTTILLEMVAAHPDVATHQYRDFPMVFTPMWWEWFLARASKADDTPFERAHKDRILVTRSSPEAIEEMLWMHFFPQCHDAAAEHVLTATTDNPAFSQFYRDHIRKLLFLRGGKRYLAKGNYNVARIQYLLKLFPDARFMVPMRDPVGHIASLMKQHKLFVDMEREDERVLSYMRRVGHFEFGLDRRPINVDLGGRTDEVRKLWESGEEVRGWAVYWSSIYDHVADVIEANAEVRNALMLVHYQDLCSDSKGMLQKVYAHTHLRVDDVTLDSQAAMLSPPNYYKPPFTDEELAVIEKETATVFDRVRSFC